MIWKNYAGPKPDPNGLKQLASCGISAFINVDGKRESGAKVKKMITTLRDRENGLGAGFAAYGIFPDYADQYCLQFFFDSEKIKDAVMEFLKERGDIVHSEPVPTKVPANVTNPPIIWRVFFEPPEKLSAREQDNYIVEIVMIINAEFTGAFIISSGKNMAVFKGNGWSSEIADFYQIENYKGYLWLAHSRFPTNTPGWWGGAHPFSILDWAVVHNGEITSYGTNKRFLEAYGYKCTLLTDTEVLAYLFDLLVRDHEIPIPVATQAFNPPLYKEISLMPAEQQLVLKNIRMTYRSAMVNGPFAIAVGRELPVPTLIGLTDRKKLRPLVVCESTSGDSYYISSEEASFMRLSLDNDFRLEYENAWTPNAGCPVIIKQGEGLIYNGLEKPFEKIDLEIEAMEEEKEHYIVNIDAVEQQMKKGGRF